MHKPSELQAVNEANATCVARAAESPKHLPITSSLEIKRSLLKAVGISERNVTDVELDLSEGIAKLKVTIAVPACVNGLIVTEVQQYDLVSRSPEAQA